MIQVDLITGFLGAGKTTFLLKYARFLMNQGLRIGILEYDFGAINVDMLLAGQLRGPKCEIEMLAAACDQDCLQRRFQTKLIAMAMSGYDRVIVEPSGVFDMDLFFDLLRDEPLEKWYEIGSVITIVNANLKDDLSEADNFVLASQAAGAGCVVLSRTQLSTPGQIQNTKDHIHKAAQEIACRNFSPKYFEKDWEEMTEDDFRRLAGCGFKVPSYVKKVFAESMEFASVSFLNPPDGLLAFEEKLSLLFSDKSYGNVDRIKGFISDQGKSYQINATEYEKIVEFTKIGQRVITVIGSNLNEEKIKELIMA